MRGIFFKLHLRSVCTDSVIPAGSGDCPRPRDGQAWLTCVLFVRAWVFVLPFCVAGAACSFPDCPVRRVPPLCIVSYRIRLRMFAVRPFTSNLRIFILKYPVNAETLIWQVMRFGYFINIKTAVKPGNRPRNLSYAGASPFVNHLIYFPPH